MAEIPRLLPDIASCERENDAADGVAERHPQQQAHRLDAPDIRDRKVEHIGNAVLVAAEDKDRHAEEKRHVLADLVRNGLKTLDADVDENIAQRREIDRKKYEEECASREREEGKPAEESIGVGGLSPTIQNGRNNTTMVA